MGILQSSTRFRVSKEKDEEGDDEIPIPPDLQDHYISRGDSAERLPLPLNKLFIFSISLYKLLKGLLRKAGSILYLAKPRKAADPLLPVQNPASSISNEPLLHSSPTYNTTFHDEEENYTSQTDRHVVAGDEMMHAAVFIEEDASIKKITTGINSEEEEEEVTIKSVIVVKEERWMNEYSSGHRILLVGEGDFSFSACLAVAFQWASNIIATSLDSQAFLKKNYCKSVSNIEELRSRGSTVMHGIDATTMANHQLLRQLRFDRIIFNFPYVGLDIKNLSRQAQLRQHQTLVRLFLQNAREMISENGEIHITHKTNGFHSEWRLESLARGCGLTLIEAIKFNYLDYPGYNTKCGFGGSKNFNCNPSKTYKFGLK